MRQQVAIVLGLAGCGGAAANGGGGEHPTRDQIQLAPMLELDAPVHGSTDDPMPFVGAICTGGGTAGKLSARAYRFVAPRTATYRFDVRADYPAVLEIGMTRPGPQENRDIACAGTRTFAVRTVLRGGETYSVTIDGQMQAQGAYDLVAHVDDSTAARIRPEDPATTARLVAAAPRLEPGRVLGTFASVAAGPRPACGGLGGGTVYTLELAAASTLELHAVAQFPAAIEVRDRSGAALACSRSAPGRFELALSRALPAGSYVIVLDATEAAPELFDPLRESPIRVDTPGAGVRGGFVLDATVTP